MILPLGLRCATQFFTSISGSQYFGRYDAVLDHDKRNAMALAYKGLSIGEMGNIPSSIKYFKKALRMDQDYDLAQISLLTAKNILKNTS